MAEVLRRGAPRAVRGEGETGRSIQGKGLERLAGPELQGSSRRLLPSGEDRTGLGVEMRVM